MEDKDELDVETKRAKRRIWKTKITSKIKVFVWRMVFNTLPARDQLAKSEIIHNAHERIFVFCFEKDENLSHFFFQCIVNTKV